MEPTTAAQKSRAQLRRIVADESQRFPALLLASVMCTIASLIAAAAFFAIRPHAGWLVPVMLLQIAVIVCAVVAQQAVHGPAAWSRCRKRRCDGGTNAG